MTEFTPPKDLTKTPLRRGRHSSDLLSLIAKVREKYPDAVEGFIDSEGKRSWVIQSGGKLLSRAHSTQWAAWEDAAIANYSE